MPVDRLRVVVMGYLIREPTGGQAWHYLNYVHGFADLGHDVYYIEDSDDEPMCWSPFSETFSTDAEYGLQFAAAAFGRLGLGERWAYFDAHRNEWRGARAADAPALCRSADLVVNVSAVNPLRDWLVRAPARVIIDTDPGFTQIRHLANPRWRAICAAHTCFLTFGANYGEAFCSLPRDGFPWQPTRQPVSLTAWAGDTAGPRDGKLTTMMQWDSFPAPFEWGDVHLAMKSESFAPFLALPERTGPIFEIAVRGSAAVLAALRTAGWGLAEVNRVGDDPWTFQRFIRRSKAEFGIAKAGYVTTRSGWFSERSANYLASGRPVLHQDTGFGEWLPCGRGVIPFRSVDDAVAALALLDRDYEAQCRAARALAAEHFGSRPVLRSLIAAATAT